MLKVLSMKKKKEIIIEKIESNIKEVERKEKERKYNYEEVQKNKSCKRKEEERKKETVEEKDLFENMEDKTKKFQKERKEKRNRFFFNQLTIDAGLDLRTNPPEVWENDEIMSSLSMWKETYKKSAPNKMC